MKSFYVDIDHVWTWSERQQTMIYLNQGCPCWYTFPRLMLTVNKDFIKDIATLMKKRAGKFIYILIFHMPKACDKF